MSSSIPNRLKGPFRQGINSVRIEFKAPRSALLASESLPMVIISPRSIELGVRSGAFSMV